MNLAFINRQFKDTKNDLLLFKAIGKCTLSNYIVYDKTYDESGDESNIFPHMYRFPDIMLEKGEYVALRLHKGKIRKRFAIMFIGGWKTMFPSLMMMGISFI